MHETENRLNRFYSGDSTEPSMDSILELAVSSTIVALVQAHSHKKLAGLSQAAEHCHERSSQAPGVGLEHESRDKHQSRAARALSHPYELPPGCEGVSPPRPCELVEGT